MDLVFLHSPEMSKMFPVNHAFITLANQNCSQELE